MSRAGAIFISGQDGTDARIKRDSACGSSKFEQLGLRRNRGDGIQHLMSPSREITVAPDRFEATGEDAVLVTELQSAIAVCVYDAVEEAGALLHLRCLVRTPKPADMTDTTLATELLLLDRCVETMRELAPGARNLQARVVAHLADHPRARETCDSVLTMV